MSAKCALRVFVAGICWLLAPFNAYAAVYGPGTSTGVHTISWDPASAGPNVTIWYYLVTETFNGSSTDHSVNGTSESFTRNVNGSYQYSVKAVKETCNPRTYDCNVITQILGTVTVNVAVQVPGIPGALSLPNASSDGAYVVSWGAASGLITHYELQQSANGGGWTTLQSSSALSRSITGQGQGSYSYRVRACNASGCGGFNSTQIIQIAYPPGVPAGISAPSSNSTGTYTVTWGAATGVVSSYSLQERINGGGWNTIQSSAQLSRTISGKSNGTYGYRVQACNAASCGTFTTEHSVVVGLLPQSPASVSVPGTSSSGDYSVTWPAASGATRYEIAEEYNSAGWGQFTSVSTSLTKAYSSKPAGRYRYQVRGCNDSGCSNPTTSGYLIVDRTPGKQVRFIHTDVLGSPATETDETGNEVNAQP